MADIRLGIEANADFSQVYAALQKLKAEIASLQAAGGNNLLSNVRNGISNLNQELEETGKFRVHMLDATTAADRLNERIRRNRTSFSDLRMAMSSVNKEGNIFLDLGKKNVAMQEAQAIRVGKTTYVYENLAMSFANSAKAAQANAVAIAAQNKVLKEHALNIINTGKNYQWTGRQLTMGITMPLAMFGAQSAKIFNEVDKNLTRLAKVYGVGLAEPTQQALAQIRKDTLALSMELGKSLGIASTEVTDIAAQFAAAGLQGKELIAATRQASRIVVLGEADKQEAIDATISLQTAYKLNTDELTEAVNFFNAAQAATSTSMGDLINAIPRVGPVVKGLGGTYKDMVAILTALKEGGVPASEAANAIKNSLARIINPTATAKKELLGFGIDLEKIVNKNAGNLIGTITELQSGLDNLDNLSKQKAISELFGKYQFARMSAFIENFNKQGTQSSKVMEMMGLSSVQLADIADKQTKKIQQSASGRFKIAVETMKNALIPFGEFFLETFTNILDKVTGVITAIEELPAPVKNFLKIIGGFTALVGPAIMIGGLIGNMAGSILLGVTRLKVFAGAIKQLFTGGGMNGFRTILTGFKDADLVADAAAKAVDLFNSEISTGTTNAAQVFEAGIEKMILSLQDLSKQAITTMEIVAKAQPVPISGGRDKRLSALNSPVAFVDRRANEFQGLFQNSDFPYLQPGQSVRQAYQAHLSTLSPQVQSNIKLEQARYSSNELEQILKQLYITKEQHVKSIAGYLTRIDIVMNSNRDEWVAETRKLNAIAKGIKSGTHTVDQWRSAMKAFYEKFKLTLDTMDKSSLDAMQKRTAALMGMTEQQILQTSMREETLGRVYLNTGGYEGFHQLSGGAAGTDAAARLAALSQDEAWGTSFLSTVTPGSKGATSKLGQHHLYPATNLANLIDDEIRRVIETVGSITHQEVLDIIAGISNSPSGIQAITAKNITELKSVLTKAGSTVSDMVTIRGKKYIADVTNGADNIIVWEFDNKTKMANRVLQQEIVKEVADDQRVRDALTRLKNASNQLETAVVNEIVDGANDLQMAANQVNQSDVPSPARGSRSQRFMRGAGAVGMMSSMGMMSFGYGNETANQAMMGLSSASMVTSMLPASMAGGPAGVAIFAAIAALPLLIKGMQSVVDNASKMNRAMEGAFKTSQTEAEMLNIKLNRFGSYEAPKATEEAKKAATAIESMAKSISDLGDEDPLKSFTNSLKGLSTEDQLKLLQSKYLTLRIQGVEDQEARDFVRAIMKAAGIEMQQAGGVNFNNWVNANSSKSVSDMISQNAMSSLDMINQTNGLLDFGASTSDILKQLAEDGLATGNIFTANFGPAADAARKSVEGLALNLNDLMATASQTGDFKTLSSQLSEIRDAMSKNKDSAYLYEAAIRELYEQAGMISVWDDLVAAGVGADKQMKLLQLRANGLANDLEYLTEHPWEINVRFKRLANITELSQMASGIMSDLADVAGRTTFTSNSADAAASAEQKKADAQQNVVDKLQEELNLRNKIIDAQAKQLEFSMSQASLQQQYNAAIASNDLAKAADLQRQMTLEQKSYNDELKKAALEDKLSKQQAQLSETQKNIQDVKSSAVETTESLADYEDELWDLVVKTASEGEAATKEELNKVAKELHEKFQIPMSKIKTTVLESAKAFKSDPIARYALEAGNALDSDLIPSQKQSAILQAYVNILAKNPGLASEEAYAKAIESVMPGYNVTAKRDPISGEVNYYASVGVGSSSASNWTFPLTAGGGVSGATTNAANAGSNPTGENLPPSKFRSGKYSFGDTWESRTGKEWTLTGSLKNPYWLSSTGGQVPVQFLANGGLVRNYESGGRISGPGTGTSDSILARVSNGEFVMKANAVKHWGVDTLHAMNSSVPTYATGGYVGENPPIQRFMIGGEVLGGSTKKKNKKGPAASYPFSSPVSTGFNYANWNNGGGAKYKDDVIGQFLRDELLGFDDFGWMVKNAMAGNWGESLKSGGVGALELGTSIASIFSGGMPTVALKGGSAGLKLGSKFAPALGKIAGSKGFSMFGKGLDWLYKGMTGYAGFNILRGEGSKEDWRNLIWGIPAIRSMAGGISNIGSKATSIKDSLAFWLKSKGGLYHGGMSGLNSSSFKLQDLRGWNFPATYFTPEKYIAGSYAMANRFGSSSAVYKLGVGLKQALGSNVFNFSRRITQSEKQALISELVSSGLNPENVGRVIELINSSKTVDQASSVFRGIAGEGSGWRQKSNEIFDSIFNLSSYDAAINYNKFSTKFRNIPHSFKDTLSGMAISDDVNQTFIRNLSKFNMNEITNPETFFENIPGISGPLWKFLRRNTDGLESSSNVWAATRPKNWMLYLQALKYMNKPGYSVSPKNITSMLSGLSSILGVKTLSGSNRLKKIMGAGFDVEEAVKSMIGMTSIATGGYINRGKVELPKYHNGGLVNYAYGKEVAAMLEGGEVVIPKEVVKNVQNGGATNSNSVYNNITVNVPQTNANPQEIANAVSIALQNRNNRATSRTVIR